MKQKSINGEECVDCKEGKIRAEEQQYGKKKVVNCNVLYFEVDRCMKANAGQVSACQEEWSKFRECHDRDKNR